MQLHNRSLPGRTGITIGHRHGRTFMQTGCILQPGSVHQRIEETNLLRASQAEDIRYLPVDQKLSHEFATGMVFKYPPTFGRVV